MIVKVTAEDILAGQPNSPTCCPVARAIARIFPERYIISVVYYRVDIHRGEEYDRVLFPPEVKIFIYHFDDSERRSLCQPFEFELPIDHLLPKPSVS